MLSVKFNCPAQARTLSRPRSARTLAYDPLARSPASGPEARTGADKMNSSRQLPQSSVAPSAYAALPRWAVLEDPR